MDRLNGGKDGVNEYKAFSGSLPQAIRSIFELIEKLRDETQKVFSEMRQDSANQWKEIREQDTRCAGRQIETERRIANGHGEESKPAPAQEASTVITLKTAFLALAGAGVVVGTAAAVLGFFALKYSGIFKALTEL